MPVKHQWASDEDLQKDFLRDTAAVDPKYLSRMDLTTREAWEVIWYLQAALVAVPSDTAGHPGAVETCERLIALNAHTPAQREFARRGWLTIEPPKLPDSETAASIGATPEEPANTESSTAAGAGSSTNEGGK